LNTPEKEKRIVPEINQALVSYLGETIEDYCRKELSET
jgi:hypothetical protein